MTDMYPFPRDTNYAHIPPPFGRIKELRDSGDIDTALLLYIQQTDCVSVNDLTGLKSFKDTGERLCLIQVAPNLVLPDPLPEPLARRLLRMLQYNELILHPTGLYENQRFVANSPDVLTGRYAKIIGYERNVREMLVNENRVGLEDRVWRAYGMLERARLITSEETMDYLSAVRMGVNLGLIDKIPIGAVNELFILTQPAHLQKLEGRELETPERDQTRAEFIRKKLLSLN